MGYLLKSKHQKPACQQGMNRQDSDTNYGHEISFSYEFNLPSHGSYSPYTRCRFRNPSVNGDETCFNLSPLKWLALVCCKISLSSGFLAEGSIEGNYSSYEFLESWVEFLYCFRDLFLLPNSLDHPKNGTQTFCVLDWVGRKRTGCHWLTFFFVQILIRDNSG